MDIPYDGRCGRALYWRRALFRTVCAEDSAAGGPGDAEAWPGAGLDVATSLCAAGAGASTHNKPGIGQSHSGKPCIIKYACQPTCDTLSMASRCPPTSNAEHE